ncbi:hypothetical protein M0802_008862 [Mischocyttarus mexicanus]|nr:hypothetical protein M0802_008862 [Mischocyttarus mexicanus]
MEKDSRGLKSGLWRKNPGELKSRPWRKTTVGLKGGSWRMIAFVFDFLNDYLHIFFKVFSEPIEKRKENCYEFSSLDSVNGTGRIHGSFKPLTRGAPVPYTASGFPTCS